MKEETRERHDREKQMRRYDANMNKYGHFSHGPWNKGRAGRKVVEPIPNPDTAVTEFMTARLKNYMAKQVSEEKTLQTTRSAETEGEF